MTQAKPLLFLILVLFLSSKGKLSSMFTFSPRARSKIICAQFATVKPYQIQYQTSGS